MTRRPAPADLRLLPPALAAWLASWFGLTLPPLFSVAAAAVFLLLGAFGLLRCRRRVLSHPLDLPPSAVSVYTALLVGAGFAASGALHLLAVQAGPVPQLAHQSAMVGAVLTVTGDPRRIVLNRPGAIGSASPRPGSAARPAWSRNDQDLLLIPARMNEVSASGATYAVRSVVTMFVYVGKSPSPTDRRWLDLLPSTAISVRGRLAEALPGTGESAVLKAAKGAPIVVGRPSVLQSAAGRLRADLRAAVAGLPAEPAGLLPALAVGDTSREPPELADAFKATGLTYLTVVSGENLVFCSIALLPLVRWAGVRGRAVPLAGAVLALGFTAVARPGPPMVRATVMALFAATASITGRRFRALPVMAAAVLVLLWYDPWLAHEYGFVLSVAATAGLLILSPGWHGRLADRGVPDWAAVAISATAAAEVFCEPLLVTFTGQLPLLAVVCNVAAVPAAPVATVLGVAAMLGAAVWLPLGHVIAWLGQWPVRWICLVAETGSAVPGAVLPWPRGALGGLLLVANYVLIAYFAGVDFRQTVTKARLDKQKVSSV
ncbi:MAG TPA: ComEC/Rec2 family competence protein [Actinocrinis sp.]|nr:ComEC/Rec2 family competence protein [Actinocrinis sp.]